MSQAAGPRPRVAIVTNGNYFANLALSTLLRQTAADIDYRVVVTSGLRRQHGNRAAEAWGLFRRWGWRYSAYKASTYALPKLLVRPAPASVRQTCEKLDIPALMVRNVNHDPGASWLAEFQPDILVSFSCPYRIGNALLDLPSIGALNVHSSMLPEHAGVCTYVHVLADGRTTTGVTVHEMVERFDAGRVVAQAEVPIEQPTSVFALFSTQCRVAGDLLVTCVCDSIESGKVSGNLQDEAHRTYRGEPGRADIRRLRSHGHRLLRVRDLRVVRGLRGDR